MGSTSWRSHDPPDECGHNANQDEADPASPGEHGPKPIPVNGEQPEGQPGNQRSPRGENSQNGEEQSPNRYRDFHQADDQLFHRESTFRESSTAIAIPWIENASTGYTRDVIPHVWLKCQYW